MKRDEIKAIYNFEPNADIDLVERFPYLSDEQKKGIQQLQSEIRALMTPLFRQVIKQRVSLKPSPLDNIYTKRGLRLLKVQKKVRGCFRAQHGATDFCQIGSYLSKMKKLGHNISDVFRSVFSSTSLVSALHG